MRDSRSHFGQQFFGIQVQHRLEPVDQIPNVQGIAPGRPISVGRIGHEQERLLPGGRSGQGNRAGDDRFRAADQMVGAEDGFAFAPIDVDEALGAAATARGLVQADPRLKLAHRCRQIELQLGKGLHAEAPAIGLAAVAQGVPLHVAVGLAAPAAADGPALDDLGRLDLRERHFLGQEKTPPLDVRVAHPERVEAPGGRQQMEPVLRISGHGPRLESRQRRRGDQPGERLDAQQPGRAVGREDGQAFVIRVPGSLSRKVQFGDLTERDPPRPLGQQQYD